MSLLFTTKNQRLFFFLVHSLKEILKQFSLLRFFVKLFAFIDDGDDDDDDVAVLVSVMAMVLAMYKERERECARDLCTHKNSSFFLFLSL